jgi:hypothetical protein
MTPIEIDEFKTKIQKETIDTIVKKIEVQDSYFYAQMIVSKNVDAMDPFGSKLNVIIKMNLFNSKSFELPNLINTRPKVLKAKEIVSRFQIDSEKLIQNKEDAIILVYEEVGKQIAMQLFQENARNIHMTVHDTQRTYI